MKVQLQYAKALRKANQPDRAIIELKKLEDSIEANLRDKQKRVEELNKLAQRVERPPTPMNSKS